MRCDVRVARTIGIDNQRMNLLLQGVDPLRQDQKSMSENPGMPLRRELGLLDFTAIGINILIGGSIFLIGSTVHRLAGSWSVSAFFAVGIMALLLGLTVAGVASRFEGTGGPAEYVHAAFGRFAGFEIAWLMWITRVIVQASLSNGIVLSLTPYFPALGQGYFRGAAIVVINLGLMMIALRGIRQTARTIKTFALLKLVPFALVLALGLRQIDLATALPVTPFNPPAFGSVLLLLVFSFSGYELIPVTAGEGRNARRDAPRAVVISILSLLVVICSLQLVLVSTVPELAASTTPVADAARALAGERGFLIVSIGAVVSTTGTCFGMILAASRLLYSQSVDGNLPEVFGRLEPQRRVPGAAIVFSTLCALTLALTGSFVALAAVSAVPRLLTLIAVALAECRFQSAAGKTSAPAALFRLPGGRVIPFTGCLLAGAILCGVSWTQFGAGAGAVLCGAVVYLIARRQRS